MKSVKNRLIVLLAFSTYPLLYLGLLGGVIWFVVWLLRHLGVIH